MSKIRGIKTGYSLLRRVFVGVLCLVLTAASLSDVLAHSDHHHDADDIHSVLTAHNMIDASAHDENHNDDLGGERKCSHSESPALDQTTDPHQGNCQFGCDAHICLTAVLNRTTDVFARPSVVAQLKRACESALPHVNAGLYRPPIFSL